MMKSYSASLTKNFKKQIENGLFSFLIVDNINDKNAHYEEMWSFAKLKGYEVRETNQRIIFCHSILATFTIF